MIARDIFPDDPDKDVLAHREREEAEAWRPEPLTDEEMDAMWTEEQAYRAVHMHQHECGHDCTGVACRLYRYIDPQCLSCQRRRYGL